MNKVLTIVFVSDTHGLHRYVTIPPCHILVHCGDIQGNDNDKKVLKDAAAWLREQEAEQVVFVPGNHDRFFQHAEKYARQVFHGIHVLIDQSVELHGIKFYGSPWCTPFCDWYFEAEEPSLYDKFAKIPEDTDILVTHSPAHGYLDYTPNGYHAGSTSLGYHVMRVKPKVHAFGHIHYARGRKDEQNITFINAAYADTKNGYYDVNPDYDIHQVYLTGTYDWTI